MAEVNGHDIRVIPSMVEIDYGPWDRKPPEETVIGCVRCGIIIKHIDELKGHPCI